MMETLPANFKPVYRYKMENGNPVNCEEIQNALWHEKGVVYARVYQDHVVYVGSTDGTLRARVLRHIKGISKARPGKAGEYRGWANGKTITILAYKPEPVEWSGMKVDLHRGLEAALIREFRPSSKDCNQPWFVSRA